MGPDWATHHCLLIIGLKWEIAMFTVARTTQNVQVKCMFVYVLVRPKRPQHLAGFLVQGLRFGGLGCAGRALALLASPPCPPTLHSIRV